MISGEYSLQSVNILHERITWYFYHHKIEFRIVQMSKSFRSPVSLKYEWCESDYDFAKKGKWQNDDVKSKDKLEIWYKKKHASFSLKT